MGRNGDAQKTRIQTPNTVNAICIVVETVQESLWNLNLNLYLNLNLNLNLHLSHCQQLQFQMLVL